MAVAEIDIDFISLFKKLKKQKAFSKSQLLARAIGFKGQPLKILDATAGFGRDSLFFLGLGCEVTAVEKSPVIFDLLKDAVERATKDPEVAQIFGRFKLIFADSGDFLKTSRKDELFDVVYLDPMYPEKTKSALPKKSMLILKGIVGADLDSADLLSIALSHVKGRVVVKRPPKGKPLLEPMNHSFYGKSVRYDMYLSNLKKNDVGCE